MSAPTNGAGRGAGEPRGRGRRPGGPDTRGQILTAARRSFADKGFGRTTIRAVAGDADVDPALVHHYFGSKDDLFLAAMDIPVDPRALVPKVFADGVSQAGERLVRLFLSVWDDPRIRLPLIALVRTSLVQEAPETLLEQGIRLVVLGPLRAALPSEEADRRVQLVVSQMAGWQILPSQSINIFTGQDDIGNMVCTRRISEAGCVKASGLSSS